MLKNTIVALSLLALLASPSLALSQSTSSSSVSSDTQLLLDKLDSLKKELIALLQAQIDDLLEQIRELQAAAGITSSSTSSGSSSSTGTTGSTSGSTTSSGGATTNTTNTSSSNTQTTTYTSASDTTVPSVSLSAPSAGATVSGTATISATASDNVIVSRVDFSVDGVIKNSDYSSPYSFSWDTTNAGAHACLGAHTHSISARAYDAAGNWANTSITVNMNNPSYCTSSTATTGGSSTNASASTQSAVYINTAKTSYGSLLINGTGFITDTSGGCKNTVAVKNVGTGSVTTYGGRCAVSPGTSSADSPAGTQNIYSNYPSGPATYSVTVTNTNGTSNAVQFTIVAEPSPPAVTTPPPYSGPPTLGCDSGDGWDGKYVVEAGGRYILTLDGQLIKSGASVEWKNETGNVTIVSQSGDNAVSVNHIAPVEPATSAQTGYYGALQFSFETLTNLVPADHQIRVKNSDGSVTNWCTLRIKSPPGKPIITGVSTLIVTAGSAATVDVFGNNFTPTMSFKYKSYFLSNNDSNCVNLSCGVISGGAESQLAFDFISNNHIRFSERSLPQSTTGGLGPVGSYYIMFDPLTNPASFILNVVVYSYSPPALPFRLPDHFN